MILCVYLLATPVSTFLCKFSLIVYQVHQQYSFVFLLLVKYYKMYF